MEEFSNLQIDIRSLPQHQEVVLQRLHSRYLTKLDLSTSISLLFFVSGLVIGFFFLPDYPLFLGVGTGLVVLLFSWFYYNNRQLLKRNGYALREQDVIYKRGFLFEKTTVVPFNRVQHVSIERDFLDKLIGISTLKIFTAGGSGSDVNIPGLEPKTATSLKEAISDRIASHA